MILTEMWNVLCQLAPWLLFGMLIAGILHIALPQGFIHRRLRGSWGVVKAVAIGVPLPLCSCGVVPAGIGLRKDGASNGASVGFLISTPQTGVDSILVSASFLGWPFALFKVVSAAVTGMVGGWWADRAVPDDQHPDQQTIAPDENRPRSLRELMAHALEILRSIWIWMVLGIIASACITVLVPSEWFVAAGRMGSVPSAFIALVISLPLYVCATASVPIAAALVAGGLPPGAALVFLMAGPATNLATVGAVYRRFGGRIVAVYLSTIIVGSIVAAAIFDSVLPQQIEAVVGGHHEHHSWWAQASAVTLIGLFSAFAIADTRRWFARRAMRRRPSADDLRIEVHGMTCAACVNRLETAFRQTPGVDSVVVQLEPGEAVVSGSIDYDTASKVVSKAGFEPAQPLPRA